VLAEELQGHDHGDEAVAVALEFEEASNCASVMKKRRWR
jgi:hypothetical protein